MNEAQPSNKSADLFESNDSQNVSIQVEEVEIPSVEVQPSTQEDWETVNFPNALSVDEIPHAEEVEQASDRIQALEHQCATANDRVQTLEQQQSVAADRIRQLEQRNRELLTQATRLEAAMEQSRKAIRLERRRWKAQLLTQIAQAEEKFQAQAAIVTQKNQEIADAQEYATKLFQELEQSHQTAQKQQILVETFTGQLQSSHEQIAQLERDCALTQQRYDEQIQIARQAETSCRDLQSRLNRQQRYTLQFKAALEKCLDVPNSLPNTQSAVDVSEATVSETVAETASTQLFAPKASPVQPWSAQAEFPATEPESDPFSPDSFSMVIMPPASWEVEPESLEDASADRNPASFEEALTIETLKVPPMRTSLPMQLAPVSYTIGRVEDANSQESSHHWDVQLFSPQPVTLQTERLEQMPVETKDSEQPITESDLEQKLNTALETFAVSPNLEATEPERVDEESVIEEIDRLEEGLQNDSTPEIAEDVTATSASSEPTLEETPTETTVKTVFAELFVTPYELAVDQSEVSSSPFITLQPAAELAIESLPESQPQETEAAASMPFRNNGPSPVVYPLRSTQKRKSLAAVELPSFPRRV